MASDWPGQEKNTTWILHESHSFATVWIVKGHNKTKCCLASKQNQSQWSELLPQSTSREEQRDCGSTSSENKQGLHSGCYTWSSHDCTGSAECVCSFYMLNSFVAEDKTRKAADSCSITAPVHTQVQIFFWFLNFSAAVPNNSHDL